MEYALGVVTLPIYRRLKDTASMRLAAWRKCGVPFAVVLAPVEGEDHHMKKMMWAMVLLTRVLLAVSAPVPAPLIYQTHGDWTKTLWKGHPSENKVVCDLEHLYRKVKDSDLGLCPTGTFLRRVRTSHVIPGAFNFSFYWEVHKQRMSEWQCKSFCKAWYKERIFAYEVLDCDVVSKLYMSSFWCGMGSKVRQGHEASQNIAEQVMKVCRDVSNMEEAAGQTREEIYMGKLEERARTLCDSRGFENSLNNIDQQHIFGPIPPDSPSPDLISGKPRPWHTMKDQLTHPNVELIDEAQKLHQCAAVVVGGYTVFRTFWCLKSEYYVPLGDAVSLSKLLDAGLPGGSLAEVRAEWRRLGLVNVKEGNATESVVDEQVEKFFWKLCAVTGSAKKHTLQCSCVLFRSRSECGHVYWKYKAEGVFKYDDSGLPFGRSGAKGRVSHQEVRGRGRSSGPGRGSARGRAAQSRGRGVAKNSSAGRARQTSRSPRRGASGQRGGTSAACAQASAADVCADGASVSLGAGRVALLPVAQPARLRATEPSVEHSKQVCTPDVVASGPRGANGGDDASDCDSALSSTEVFGRGSSRRPGVRQQPAAPSPAERDASAQALKVPPGILALLHQLFSESDTKGVQSMAWLLADVAGTELRAIVKTQHLADADSIDQCRAGVEQLADFLRRDPSHSVVGWVVSHHTKSAKPTLTDLQRHWKFLRMVATHQHRFVLAVAWRRGAELVAGCQFHTLRACEANLNTLEEHNGKVDAGSYGAESFLEPAAISEDGAAIAVKRLGGVMGSPPGADATASASIMKDPLSLLLKAQANDLLHFLRSRAAGQPHQVMHVKAWIDDVVLAGTYGQPMGQQKTTVRRALEHLIHERFLSVHRPPASRFDVLSWSVQLL